MSRTERFFPRPLIFLHVPKAAGTTLEEVILRQYRGYHAYRFTGSQEVMSHFVNMPVAARSLYDILCGHVNFGIHKHINVPATYVTMLRDPIDRVVSHYYFVLRSPKHYLHTYVTENNISLRDYTTKCITEEIDNDQVRWFQERDHREIPIGSVDQAMLDQAKANLDQVAVVGLAERFHESLVMMQCEFGWLNVAYKKRKNETLDRPKLSDVPSGDLDVLREFLKYDVELYEHAKRLFERQIDRVGAALHASPAAQAAVEGHDPQAAFRKRVDHFEATFAEAAKAAEESDKLWEQAAATYRQAIQLIDQASVHRKHCHMALARGVLVPDNARSSVDVTPQPPASLPTPESTTEAITQAAS